MEFLPVKRALLSVTDKSGLVDFAGFLAGNGVELVSTGGTFKILTRAGLPVIQVSTLTGFPEILDGRVKTLHPGIHGGILADKDNPAHLRALEELRLRAFDLVCVNLYDFSGALEKKLDLRATIEEIDIGGPCLLRAAAKNYHSVLVLPSPLFYEEARSLLQAGRLKSPLDFRRKTAAAAFAAVSAYDAMIAAWMREEMEEEIEAELRGPRRAGSNPG
ncbi:MAG: IMP cyclohydrolase [Deltaproteobacteria bacterium]|jgi:phosphoribosylaminoimidazolecarboxamide formyltransferase/IMP cyclohydrolase|nr:IMP cyclohydrolase [Deltaproteobacteria bacterium]